jgi:hypothetical protein
MSTTSSFPARCSLVLLTGVACVGIGLVACTMESGTDQASEPPTVAAPDARKPSGTLNEPVGLAKVAARRLAPDDPLLPQFLSKSQMEVIQDAVLIEVTVRQPLDPRPRSSQPVIVLNDRPLPGTRMDYESLRQLRAVVGEDDHLRERNKIEVVWLGAEAQTRSPEALFLEIGNIGER